jgi:hypothetical protein
LVRRFLAFLAPAAVAIACSHADSASPADAGAGDEAQVTCQTDSRAQTYSANMVQKGQSGVFQLALASADPAPPARGTNTWTVRVLDASGAPVTGATLDVKPFMPDHGHGTSIVATITANPDGTFGVTPLYLFMPGLWQMTFGVHAGSQNDSVVFSFCVAG